MRKFFCWLTGGHRYDDGRLTCGYDSFIGAYVRNRCAKCGKEYIATIDLHALIGRELAEYGNRYRLDVRKDGADND